MNTKQFLIWVLVIAATAFVIGPVSYFTYQSRLADIEREKIVQKAETERKQIEQQAETARTQERWHSLNSLPFLTKDETANEATD